MRICKYWMTCKFKTDWGELCRHNLPHISIPSCECKCGWGGTCLEVKDEACLEVKDEAYL
jgi:hypothetical protein